MWVPKYKKQLNPLQCNLEGCQEKLMKVLYCQWLEESTCCDLQLHTTNGIIRVHTCVMLAFSPPIAEVIGAKEQKKRNGKSFQQIIIDIQFDYDIVEMIIRSIYSGVFTTSDDCDLHQLYKALKWFGVKELEGFIEHLKQRFPMEASIDESPKKKLFPKKVMNKSLEEFLKESKNGEFTLADYVPDYFKKRFLNKKSQDSCKYKSKRLVKKKIDKILRLNAETSQVVSEDLPVTDSEEIGKIQRTKGKRKPKTGKVRERKLKFEDVGENMDSEMNAAKILVQLGSDDIDLNLVKTEVIDDEFASLDLTSEPSSTLKLKQFLLSDRASKNIKLKCDKCKALFTEADQYKDHINNHPTFPCDKCPTVFYASPALVRHTRKMHFKSKHLKCTLCEFEAITNSQFIEHCSSVHQINEPFQCKVDGCSYRTKHYRYLTRHSEIHENFRTFKCDKCEKDFKSWQCLRSHKRSCYDSQSYLCDLCGQSFNHPTSLKIHRRAMHFGEKPYQCKVCYKSFTENGNLKRHMRIHNNTFPYSCPVCQQRFRHSNTLKTHMNRHGGFDNYDMDVYRSKNSATGKKRGRNLNENFSNISSHMNNHSNQNNASSALNFEDPFDRNNSSHFEVITSNSGDSNHDHLLTKDKMVPFMPMPPSSFEKIFTMDSLLLPPQINNSPNFSDKTMTVQSSALLNQNTNSVYPTTSTVTQHPSFMTNHPMTSPTHPHHLAYDLSMPSPRSQSSASTPISTNSVHQQQSPSLITPHTSTADVSSQIPVSAVHPVSQQSQELSSLYSYSNYIRGLVWNNS